jgi:Family of unknown function (DUF6529)
LDCRVTSTASAAPAAPKPTRSAAWLLVPLTVGALAAVGFGILARESGTSGGYPGPWYRLFFSDTLHLKAWFAIAAVALACTQLFTAAWVFRKLYWPRPRWINFVHRWGGRLAFLATIPVAYHCIFKLGFQKTDTRVAVHSFFGCAVYGAFAAKVTIVRLHRFPAWVLPLAGGILFAALVGVWYTSAFWFLRLAGITTF